MSENTVTIPDGKFLSLSIGADIAVRVANFHDELKRQFHDSEEETTLVNLEEIIIRLDCAITGRPVDPTELPGYEWPHEPEDCDDRWKSGCAECEAIEKQGQGIEIPESPCPDGDTCKRVNGRIKHDRFCDNINHGDE
jgi:hypothetical protein